MLFIFICSFYIVFIFCYDIMEQTREANYCCDIMEQTGETNYCCDIMEQTGEAN